MPGKILIIAEKPSVMRRIRDVAAKTNTGYIVDCAAFHGHLMGLKSPVEYDSAWGTPWTAAQLPMIPQAWAYKAVDEASALALRDKINAGNYDYIVNACDAGREGEHIFWSFYETYGFKTPVLRLWASSVTDAALAAALKDLKPASRFDGLKAASKLRPQFDWLVGMNFSRAVSVQTHKSVAIGRVMSVVQKLVVDRENEINAFVSTGFAEITLKLKAPSGGVFEAMNRVAPDWKDTRYPDKAAAEAVKATFGKTWSVAALNEKDREVAAPTCFSLTELQKSANSEYKMSPDRTLEITQSLYEKGFVTYPRTESRYLPTDMVPELMSHIKAVFDVPDVGSEAKKIVQADIDRVTAGKMYVDDGRIEDHHAIIPTEDPVTFSALSADEQKIYSLIARQFIAIFMPPYRDKRTVAVLTDGKNMCRAEGKVVVDKGYTVLAKENTSDVVLPPLAKGDTVGYVSSTVKEGKTKPPARYTPKTILDAMKNAGQLVSDAQQRYVLKEASGIGTPATRAEILKKLVDKQLLTLEKNQYAPTAFSTAFIAEFGKKDFCSPSLTAVWEAKLHDVEEGKLQPSAFQAEMDQYICDEVQDLLTSTVNFSSYRQTILGNCPVCGKPVAALKGFYACTGSTKEEREAGTGCKFSISGKIHGAEISQSDVKAMLEGKKTSFKTFTNAEGKKYVCRLYLENGKLAREFKQAKKEKEGESFSHHVLGDCPVCRSGKIYESAKFFNCSNSSCKFAQFKTVSGATLTEADMKRMLSGGMTVPKTFQWKSGKKGSACLKYDVDGSLKFVF